MSRFTPKTPRRQNPPINVNNGIKKETVNVFCRLRPLKNDEEPTCISLKSSNILLLKSPPEAKIVKEIEAQFKHVFTSYSLQNEVFEHVALPLLKDLLNGQNGLLFTYGVTGSGKTHTLTGDHTHPGIMPKCIYTIFNTISEHQSPKYFIKSDHMNGFDIQSEEDVRRERLQELKVNLRFPKKKSKEKIYINDSIKILDFNENNLYSVFISYVEIYNNSVFDLLDDNNGKSLQNKILREDSHKNMYVFGVTEIEVKSAEEAFELFNQGQKRKKMGNTILNADSSRSHSIFNIRIVQVQQIVHNENGRQLVPDNNNMIVSQLCLVDLAGSERTNRTQNTGKLLKEASQINNSLMTLRNCLDILRENQLTCQNRLVPYRDSKLTLLFKNYFEGEGHISMIVCINPSIDDFEENLQVVKFAEATQDVKISVRTNFDSKYYTPMSKTPKSKLKLQPILTNSLKLNIIRFCNDNFDEFLDSINNIANIITHYKDKVMKHDKGIDKTILHLRDRLINMEEEFVVSQSKVKNANNLYKKEKQLTNKLEIKINEMESDSINLKSINSELNNKINELQKKLDEKDFKINQNAIEKEKVKQKFVLANEKRTQELDAKLRRQREYLQAQMKAKDTKLQKVKELIEKELSPPRTTINQVPAPSIEIETPKYVSTPLKPRREATPHIRKIRRRSRSVGGNEVWLEHNAVKPVPLGTVLQPSMKKLKSVTKLSKASDVTNPKQSKYCLIAQEQDHEGDVETKVYKGDIVQTCGGGAQVIFNDVERLTQESPTKNDNE